MQITTVGLDLAKRVFQVHGVDAGGRVVMRENFSTGRLQPSPTLRRNGCKFQEDYPRILHFRGGEGNLRRAGSRAGGSHLIV